MNSFQNCFQAELSLEMWRRLGQVYQSPLDIDLFPAGMAESPGSHDAMVGPTFGCIIARQFHNLKFGDRFDVDDVTDVTSGLNRVSTWHT